MTTTQDATQCLVHVVFMGLGGVMWMLGHSGRHSTYFP